LTPKSLVPWYATKVQESYLMEDRERQHWSKGSKFFDQFAYTGAEWAMLAMRVHTILNKSIYHDRWCVVV